MHYNMHLYALKKKDLIVHKIKRVHRIKIYFSTPKQYFLGG
jgi:hypothetical protein